MKTTMAIAAFAVIFTGCAANSSTKIAKGQQKMQPHSEPVCLLRSPLPSDIKYSMIGEVRGGKRTYGSMQEILAVMGDEARSIGADAIINIKTRHDMNAWAWARPIGSGDGIKLENKTSLDCIKLGGEFR